MLREWLSRRNSDQKNLLAQRFIAVNDILARPNDIRTSTHGLIGIRLAKPRKFYQADLNGKLFVRKSDLPDRDSTLLPTASIIASSSQRLAFEFLEQNPAIGCSYAFAKAD